MAKKSFPLGEVYAILEPGPVVLLTTALKGAKNVMPMSWLTMMEFEPPLIGCVVSAANHSFGLLRASRQCVINVPVVASIVASVRAGNCSGRSVDKFAAFGFKPLPAERVEAPLIAECPVNLECKVVDTRMVARYNLFVLEVAQAWRDPRPRRLETFHHLGHGRFMVAGRTRVVPSRMP